MLGLNALAITAVAVISYFLGCCNSSIIISKYLLKDDVRKYGSGNAGLTNFYRVYGKKNVVWVILLDVLKAVASCLIGGALLGAVMDWAILGKYIAGLFCMLGHVFPCMFGFKGGKGVLSGGAIAILLDWRIALVVFGLFAVAYAATGYVSLGSIVGAVTYIVGFAVVYPHDVPVMAGGVFLGVLAIIMHRKNIVRLLRVEESKVYLFGKGRKS